MERKELQYHIAHKKALLAVPHFHIVDSSFTVPSSGPHPQRHGGLTLL
jgi:hypothetical protein